ncbi:MAG: DNA polymerase III subunit delta [Betaproteobacteria bacterium]
MQLKSEQLAQHLTRALTPLYVVQGDEPLLTLEAADAIRAKARSEGFSERDVLTVERYFDWSQLGAAGSSMSLFAEKRLIELRIPGGKPGIDGAKAIEAYCARPIPDTLTLVMLPALDRKSQDTAWYRALSAAAVVVSVAAVDRTRLPDWIALRLAAQKQKAARASLEFIADCVEGNLLAAHQEIQKLGLLHPPGEIADEAIRAAVLNVARYDVADLSSALLAGDIARLAHMLEGLEGEGEALPRVLWIVAEDIRALARVQTAMSEGQAIPDALRTAKIWYEPRKTLVPKAARAVPAATVRNALRHAARIDRMAKGVAEGDPWTELLQLGMRFAR